MIARNYPNREVNMSIIERAEARLRASPHRPLWNIHCTYALGMLVLHGRVPSYFHMQMAQVVIADIHPQIVNEIEVVERLDSGLLD